jgi:hypothetical protein
MVREDKMDRIRNPKNESNQRSVARNRAVTNSKRPRIAEVAKLERQHAALLAAECRKRGQWYWLSFANQSEFLGGAIVWAHGMQTAVLRARRLNISCGFRGRVEVFCEPISSQIMKNHVPHDLRNRLLAQDEILERLQGQRVGIGG